MDVELKAFVDPNLQKELLEKMEYAFTHDMVFCLYAAAQIHKTKEGLVVRFGFLDIMRSMPYSFLDN